MILDFNRLNLKKSSQCKKTSPEFSTKYHSVEQLVDIKMSTVVLVLNQEGITELIEIANNIQGRVDAIVSANQKPKDRIADAGAPTSLFEAAKEKLPMILEEGEEGEKSVVATSK